MKIKFARTLAIASALSVAFAGLTAFAGAAGVQTITTYDHTAAGTSNVTVTTTITGLADNTEVAYYVCEEGAAGAVTENIVYIDQATFDADAEGGLVFTFTDTKAKFLNAMAKFGSDEDGATFPTFYFNEGTNRLNGTEETTVVKSDADWGVAVDNSIVWAGDVSVDANAKSYKGQLKGNAKYYGVKVVRLDETTDYFPAYGCADDGTFVVIIENLSLAEGETAVPFASAENIE